MQPPRPGQPAGLAPGAITDIAGIAAGHASVAGRPSGCTVVLCPDGLVCGAAVRGGAPGTRETDLLRPENTVDRVHAVLLTGGSAFGLAAADGVMRWLAERGHGLTVGSARVPIVPAAVLFDLSLPGSAVGAQPVAHPGAHPGVHPGAETGHAACVAAAAALAVGAAPAQGNAGAGLGASVGKLFGIARAMKGGVGTASVRAGGFSVGALVAVNAVGDVVDAAQRPIAGARNAAGAGLQHTTATLLAGGWPAAAAQAAAEAAAPGSATTIGVIATDALLTKAQATQLASLAHHGLARSVDPITVHDGDAFFALATGQQTRTAALPLLGVLAAEAVARAIRNAVLAAQSLPPPWSLPAACDIAVPGG